MIVYHLHRKIRGPKYFEPLDHTQKVTITITIIVFSIQRDSQSGERDIYSSNSKQTLPNQSTIKMCQIIQCVVCRKIHEYEIHVPFFPFILNHVLYIHTCLRKCGTHHLNWKSDIFSRRSSLLYFTEFKNKQQNCLIVMHFLTDTNILYGSNICQTS